MKAEALLALYERVADAPDAIARLRRFVLDLAVRGKLVEQEAADGSARALLEGTPATKDQDRPSVDFKGTEPFEIPSNWAWARLGQLGRTQTGSTPPKGRAEFYGSDVPFIRPGDLLPGFVDYSAPGLSHAGAAASGRLVRKGALLMVCIGTIGKCQIVDRTVSFNQQINALEVEGDALPRYLLTAMRSGFFQSMAWAASGKTTIAILNKGNWERLPLPIPPLAEQHRIVAKVDELMALLDRLDAARSTREATRDRLTTASLTRLTAADTDPETLRTHVRFTLDALPALTNRTDQIKQLRQSILSLAMCGRLVEQDEADEPATVALQRYRSGQQIGGTINKSRAVQESASSTPQNESSAPPGWVWTTLGEVGSWGAGSTPSRSQSEYYGGGYTWLKSGELGDSMTLSGSEETVTEKAIRECSFRLNQPGDVLIAMYGATIGKLGILAEPAVTNQAVCGCTPHPFVLNRYLFLFLLSRRASFQNASEGGAQPNISKVKIVNTAIPLPPLAEQHRIVAKVDELMSLCDRLEAALQSADTTRTRLLEALLHEALACDKPTAEAA